MEPASIVLEDVQYHWPGKRTFGLAVSQFCLAAGEKVLLLGASGSGKSTLLSLICGILTVSSGRVEVEGTELGTLGSAARDRFRAETIGLIFQQFNLLPYARVLDNILLPLHFAPVRRKRAGDLDGAVAGLCQKLDLSKDLLRSPARRLSVGQQQRVAVARALIGQPPLIVADEPTSALDVGMQQGFLELLFQQASQAGTSVLMVSHDPRLGDRFDRALSLEQIATTGIREL